MVANLATASIKALDHTETRTLAAHHGDIINVKGMGAIGDGVTDDTAAIQAAFDLAFGSWTSAHGDPNSYLNKAVYFPGGNYKVSPGVGPLTITGCANNGSGLVRLTVASTAGLVNGDMVYVRGVTGTTNANGSYRIGNLDATHMTLLDAAGGVAFNAAWTGGGTVCPPALRIKSVHGARIYGDGKAVSNLICNTSGCAVLSTNGFQYSHVHDISLVGTAGIGFDCNMVGGDATTNCQSNVFTNCRFGGGDYGCALGMGQSMGSEMTFLGCYVGTGTKAGIAWCNFNALAGTVIGGNFAANSADVGGGIGAGILIAAGACPVIHGVSFQLYDGIDIDIRNGSSDAYSIAGCRSESENFVRGPSVTTMGIAIDGCSMTSPASPGTGFFYYGGCNVAITGCTTAGGYTVNAQNARVVITNSIFVDTTYLSDGDDRFSYLEVHPMPITTQTGATYTIRSIDGGSKIRFNRATGQTVTLLRNSDSSCWLNVGSVIEVQQVGVGQTTFVGDTGVTINSSNGLKLRAQYSCATLTCDGVNVWTLTGDTTT